MKHDTTTHPTLILVRGMPGSGKSYLAEELQKAIGADKVVMLDPDATDYESGAYVTHSRALAAEGVDKEIHPYRFLRTGAYAGITERKIIIWNQPFTNQGMFGRMIANLQTYASDHGTDLPVLVVEVEVDPAIARERVLRRKRAGGHGPSDTTLERRMNDYKSFAGDGYNVVTVHGGADVSASVATVLQTLQSMA